MTGWGNLYLIGVRGILFRGVEQPKSCMEEAPTYFDKDPGHPPSVWACIDVPRNVLVVAELNTYQYQDQKIINVLALISEHQ